VKYVTVEFRQTVLGQQQLFQRRQALERSDLDVVHSVRRQIDCRQRFLRKKRTLLYAVCTKTQNVFVLLLAITYTIGIHFDQRRIRGEIVSPPIPLQKVNVK